MRTSALEKSFEMSREQYAEAGVDVDAALRELGSLSISLPCWQGDDLQGFEKSREPVASGGIQVTGNYPGRARNVDELRQDLEKAISLIPGSHRLNLHAIYGEFAARPVERNEIETAHFKNWVAWARQKRVGLDFNATCFVHPQSQLRIHVE